MFLDKMKTLASALCICAAAGTLFTGCGAENQPAGGNASNEVTRVGMLTNLNASEQQYTALIREAEKRSGQVMKPSDIVYYDTMTAMILGLNSKSVDEISVYQSMADYMTSTNPNLVPANHIKMELEDSFCCAVHEDNAALLELLNKGLESMRSDGTLTELTEKYIKNISGKESLPAVPIEKIEGADTIRVGYTGDLPPIDMVLADGSPAGFNTAVLAELGKRIGRNIEMVPISSGSRAIVLESHEVDVIFWAIVPNDKTGFRPVDIDKPKGLALTIPYYNDKITHIALGKH